MVRARTTAELIRELDLEAHNASGAALVVVLDGTTVLVWADDPHPIERLRGAVEQR